MKQYKIYLNETFDLNNTLPTTKVVPKLVWEILADVYEKDYIHNANITREDAIKIFKSNGILYGYKFKEQDEFLMFFMLTNGHIEVHFVNVTQKEANSRIKTLDKSSLNVLATIIKETLNFINNSGYSYDVHILASKDRVSLYKKLLVTTLKKHAQDWKLDRTEVNKNAIALVVTNTKNHFEEKFNQN